MEPFYRLILRRSECVGVIGGTAANVEILVDLPGDEAAADRIMDAVPTHAASMDEWFDALEAVLPMTYRLGELTPLREISTEAITGPSRVPAARAAERFLCDENTSKKRETTRAIGAASIDYADEITPLGALRQWYLLLEDWQGLTVVAAGNRDSFDLVGRAATEGIATAIERAIPTNVTNLEHWITELMRALPTGVWLRAFGNASELAEFAMETPDELLRATLARFGAPATNHPHAFELADSITRKSVVTRDMVAVGA